MKKLVVSVVGAVALTTAGMAAANHSMAASDQSFSSNSARGVYVGGNVGYGKFDQKNSGLPAKDLRGFTWNADLGYQFNKYAALEAGYTQFHTIKVNTPAGKVNNTLYGVSLLAKGILPVSEQFDLFAKAGAMDLYAKSTTGSTISRRARIVPAFGLGTSYHVTKNVSFDVQGITTLAMKGPHASSFTMPATYAGYAGVSYKFNL